MTNENLDKNIKLRVKINGYGEIEEAELGNGEKVNIT